MKFRQHQIKANFVGIGIILMVCLSVVAWAQEKAKKKIIYKADKLEGMEKDQESYKSLLGHILFVHEGVTIQADSAQYYDQKGIVEAFGHIKVTDEEGSVIVAEHLVYDLNKKLVQLEDHIIYESDTVRFHTNQMEYVVDDKKVYFYNGGELIEEDNSLQSAKGCYDEQAKTAFFYHDVKLSNKDYTLECDTLEYNTITKIARFSGHTQITTKDGDTLTTDVGGEYNTSNKSSKFKQSQIVSQGYSLSANLLQANPSGDHYMATGQVNLVDKEHQVTILGDFSQYWKDKGIIEVYGNPLLQRILANDTLYLTADTLRAVEDKQGGKNNTIWAYNNVKIFQADLQGIADSMAYYNVDSTIYFYNRPVFWSRNNQITADTIRIQVNEQNNIDKMYVSPNALIVSEDALGNYNQLKGREMVAYFKNHKLSHIDLEGNGESLYFVLDDSLKLVGKNYIRCGYMRIDTQDEELSKISFLMQPIGVFYPPNKLEDDNYLAGFSWRIRERPTIEDVLGRGYGKKALYKAFKFNEK